MSTTPITTRLPALPTTAEGSALLNMVRAASSSPQSRPLLIGSTLSFASLAILFWPNLNHFVYTWTKDENYSHGFLVPLISLYFANEAAKRGPVAMKSGTILGLALLFVAILGRLVTVALPVFFISDLAFLLALAGAVSLLFGRQVLRRYGFAIGFLVFMIPLPVALYAMIASPLQLMVSRIASLLLSLTGVPALCEGNMITLPGEIKMFVAEACSGMRQLTGFLALTTACAYLLPRPVWYRSLLIVASVPIAMAANIIRVTLTGQITYRLDAKYASGAFHTVEGLLMMGLGLLLLQGFRLALDGIVALIRKSQSPDGLAPATSQA